MKDSTKKRIKQLIEKLRECHAECCNMMDEKIFYEGSIDICSIDEVINSIENNMPNE